MLTDGASEARAAARDLATAPARVGAAVSGAFRTTAPSLEADIKAGAPFLTGELRDSMLVVVTGLDLQVISTSDHFWFVDEGTSVRPPQPFVGPAVERRAVGLQAAILKAADLL